MTHDVDELVSVRPSPLEGYDVRDLELRLETADTDSDIDTAVAQPVPLDYASEARQAWRARY